MTLRDGASSSRLPAAPTAPGALSFIGPALASLRGLFRARPPCACHLSDRHLADIGLTRADLPDHRGWRR